MGSYHPDARQYTHDNLLTLVIREQVVSNVKEIPLISHEIKIYFGAKFSLKGILIQEYMKMQLF